MSSKSSNTPQPLQISIEKYFPMVIAFFAHPPKRKIEESTLNPDAITYEVNALPNTSLIGTNQIIFQLTVKIFLDDTKEDLIGELTTQHVFTIKDLQEFITPKADQSIENGLFASLIGISISTTRGILLVKGASTPLQFFQANMLPIIDPLKMVPSNPKKASRQAKSKKPKSKK